jgi:hypothetical protein
MGFTRLPRRLRWAAPAAALVAAGGVIAAVQIPAAQASPTLPARTAEQLLTDVASAKAPVLSGTVVETAALGLPDLSGNSASLTSLLAGTHTLHVWYASQNDFRVALPGRMSETDLYRQGSTEYLWQSALNTVTKITGLPARPTGVSLPELPAFTPEQAASAVLAEVGPTTVVSTQSNVYIAGQAAYQLVLAPKATGSTVSDISIAIDARNSTPLRVQVFGQDATSPAISVAFSSVTFATPARGTVSYERVPGAKVSVINLAGQAYNGPMSAGKLPEAKLAQGKLAPGKLSEARLKAMLPAGSPLAQVHTFGSGWTTVIELPASVLSQADSASQGSEASEGAAALQALLDTAAPVHGTWGTGQLVTSGLLNVLITSDTIYAGAVEPSVLYAAAAASS